MRAYVICPVCSAKVYLKVKKDSESFSNIEYARHIKDEHPEKVSPFGVPYAATEFE